MSHDERLGTGALLRVFLDKGIVVGNLPLLVVEPAVGRVALHALAVAVDVLFVVTNAVATVVEQASQPSGILGLQNIVCLHGVGHSYTTVLNVESDEGSDAHHVAVERAGVVGNGVDGRRYDDASSLLVVEGDGLLVLEGCGGPVVQCHIELLLGLTRGIDNLLVGQALVLVERESRGYVPGSVEPLVAIALLGIFLQVGRLHHLCFDGCCSANRKDSGNHPYSNSFHNLNCFDVVYY